MAGLGTAGALVLGAAILFTLASAVVAFNGWPTLGGGGPASTSLVIARPVAGTRGHHHGTALQASAVTVSPPARHPAARSAHAGGRSAGHVATTRTIHTGGATGRLSAPVSRSGAIATQPVATRSPAPTHTTSPAPTTTTTTPASGNSGPVSPVVSTITNTATPVVSTVTGTGGSGGSTGSGTGSGVTGGTPATVAKVVGSVGKPAVNIASNVSPSAGTTANTVVTTAGNVANTASSVATTTGSTIKSTARSTTAGTNAIVGGVQSVLGRLLSGLQ
jgi:hypothetical protein